MTGAPDRSYTQYKFLISLGLGLQVAFIVFLGTRKTFAFGIVTRTCLPCPLSQLTIVVVLAQNHPKYRKKILIMKRVALWGAVSSLPQAKEISIPDQIRRGHEQAKKHGAKVITELIVPGKSRNIVLFKDACEQIEAYAKLRALIEAKGIDALVYLDPSRLGRTAALVMTVAELCTRAGILLYELDNPPASMEFHPPD